MTCTLRHWENSNGHSATNFLTATRSGLMRASSSQRSFSIMDQSNHNNNSTSLTDTSQHYGPELLLAPVAKPDFFQNTCSSAPPRDDVHTTCRPRRRPSMRDYYMQHQDETAVSFGHVTPSTLAYSIPLSDVMVVETYNVRYGSPLHKLTVTTISYGVFEFHCHTSNGHDVLLAFLQTSLAPERILDGSTGGAVGHRRSCSHGGRSRSNTPNDPTTIHTSPSHSTVSSCLDVDGLTERHVRGRMENETWPEKISRRVGRVVHSLHELSASLCDAAVCCHPQQQHSSPNEQREKPPPPSRTRYNDLGLEEEESPTNYVRQRPYKECGSTAPLLPPGLSMEHSEPELELVR